MVSVEGIPQREEVVTFTKQYASYFPGESACFTPEEAQRLADLGVISPPAAPVNVTVPHVTQAGAVLSCTMGTWEGEPTGYAYQWQLDGVAVGTNAATYGVQPGDVGQTATCIVTASNAIGSTTAPPSNGVIVT
jgi:hypothetical protein